MLDRDLAELYGVETRILIQAVKRNLQIMVTHNISLESLLRIRTRDFPFENLLSFDSI